MFLVLIFSAVSKLSPRNPPEMKMSASSENINGICMNHNSKL